MDVDQIRKSHIVLCVNQFKRQVVIVNFWKKLLIDQADADSGTQQLPGESAVAAGSGLNEAGGGDAGNKTVALGL
jgi:hypothetical protein